MTIADLMTSDVVTIAPTAPVEQAAAMMRRHNIHHLVVMKDASLVGVVSAHDIKRRRARVVTTVADVMSRHVLKVTPSATVGRVAQLMRGRAIGCLVVFARGRLAGIVTAADLLTVLGRLATRRNRATDGSAVHHRVPHRHQRPGGVW
jgi:acetoin utilization protein AcuB